MIKHLIRSLNIDISYAVNSFIYGIRKNINDVTEKDLLENTITENVIIKNISMSQASTLYSNNGTIITQAFVSDAYNCLIKGLDIENMLITTCTSTASRERLLASSSKTRMNSSPIIFRFFSGSVTPFSLP